MAEQTPVRKESEPVPAEPEDYVVPPVDVYENDDGVVLMADMPGVGEGDVAVSVDRGELTLVGRVSREKIADARVMCEECGAQGYRRVFALSEDLDGAKIDAKLSQGVLTLHIPKAETAKTRHVPIRTE